MSTAHTHRAYAEQNTQHSKHTHTHTHTTQLTPSSMEHSPAGVCAPTPAPAVDGGSTVHVSTTVPSAPRHEIRPHPVPSIDPARSWPPAVAPAAAATHWITRPGGYRWPAIASTDAGLGPNFGTTAPNVRQSARGVGLRGADHAAWHHGNGVGGNGLSNSESRCDR